MEALEKLAKNAAALDQNTIITASITAEVQKFIIQLNTKGQKTSQLFALSIDSTGKALTSGTRGRGVYSALTETISGGKKKAGDPYTLEDTGAFYKSFKITPEKTAIVIDANPTKETTDLFKEYGENILGLTDENLQLLINELIPKLQNSILDQLQA